MFTYIERSLESSKILNHCYNETRLSLYTVLEGLLKTQKVLTEHA